MLKKNTEVSIIIVHYHSKEILFNCIRSIIKSSPKMTYEIVVVDNDEIETIKKDLKKLSTKKFFF